MAIGDRIKSVPGNIFQRDFAKRIGVSLGAVQHLENDDSLPNGNALKRIHEEFGVDTNWLLSGNGSMHLENKEGGDQKSGQLNTELLESVIEWLENYLQTNSKSLQPNKKARFILFAYQYFCDTGKDVTDGEMENYLRLVA